MKFTRVSPGDLRCTISCCHWQNWISCKPQIRKVGRSGRQQVVSLRFPNLVLRETQTWKWKAEPFYMISSVASANHVDCVVHAVEGPSTGRQQSQQILLLSRLVCGTPRAHAAAVMSEPLETLFVCHHQLHYMPPFAVNLTMQCSLGATS